MLLWSPCCSLFKCFIIISSVLMFFSTYRFISKSSQIISVWKASISRTFMVSSKPYTNFPLSWLTSSKNLPIKRFSCTDLTLDRISKENSMAWLKPFSPPHETSTTFNTSACRRRSNKSDRLSSVLK